MNKAVYTSYWKDQDGFITDYSVVRHEVNLTYVGDDEIGRVIHDLFCPMRRVWDETKRAEKLPALIFRTT